jgi:GcrA cell cycle regulator
MRRRIIRPWTDDEIETLKALVAKGASPLKAAAALKRGIGSVKDKARLIGTPFQTLQEARKKWMPEPLKPSDLRPWRHGG